MIRLGLPVRRFRQSQNSPSTHSAEEGHEEGQGRKSPNPSIVRRLLDYPFPASAAHTARPSARLSASKACGSPTVGMICAFMDTVTERLPLGLEAMNWV